VSIHDWPGRAHHFELCCDDADCETLTTEVATWRQALEAMIENHDRCRPALVTILRRGQTPAKKRFRWTVWLHNGPHVDAAAEAA